MTMTPRYIPGSCASGQDRIGLVTRYHARAGRLADHAANGQAIEGITGSRSTPTSMPGCRWHSSPAATTSSTSPITGTVITVALANGDAHHGSRSRADLEAGGGQRTASDAVHRGSRWRPAYLADDVASQRLQCASVNECRARLIFVIDTSGSMQGTSIDQAKRALGLALSGLTPQPIAFNVIQFNSTTECAVPEQRRRIRNPTSRSRDATLTG